MGESSASVDTDTGRYISYLVNESLEGLSNIVLRDNISERLRPIFLDPRET